MKTYYIFDTDRTVNTVYNLYNTTIENPFYKNLEKYARWNKVVEDLLLETGESFLTGIKVGHTDLGVYKPEYQYDILKQYYNITPIEPKRYRYVGTTNVYLY
jgi:hypothetical protein